MELKTFDDFDKHWFKRVYAFNTEIQYSDYNSVPYFDLVKEGKLICTYESFDDKIARYEVRKYAWEEKDETRIYGIEINGQDGVTKGNNIKIFTDEKEAHKFANKYRKKHEKELKEIYNHVKECTVTRAQIAEKFGIPLNELVIAEY